MSVLGEFYQFVDGELRHVDDTLNETLTVADSFLLENGKVRFLDRHFNRFANSITNPHISRELNQFFAAVLQQLPKTGAWFPRIEYRAELPKGEQLVLRIREAPERTKTLTLWTSDEPDPRRQPRTKGPDLSACQRLRRAANLRGADEAVIVNPDGFICDGALSAIVWWRGDVLEAPDDSTSWLPSITRELVFELAKNAGHEVLETRAKPEDLQGCEVWSLSSLQGIRAATQWGEIEIAPPRYASPFSKRLSLLASEPAQVKSSVA